MENLEEPSIEPVGSPNRRMIVAVGDRVSSELAVRDACVLATALQASWQAVHIETPSNSDAEPSRLRAADALGLAASLGATVATVPAATVLEGLVAQAEEQHATDLVLQWSSSSAWARHLRPSLLTAIAERCPQLQIHVLPRGIPSIPSNRTLGAKLKGAAPVTSSSFVAAAGYVALAAAVIEPVWHIMGSRGVDILFLLPVTAASVRLGIRQGIFASALSVIVYNFLFLRPVFQFTLYAPQNAVMLAVLLGAALYTGILSERLRGRLRLSDRSAKENAAIVAFAQELSRAADWEHTAGVVCAGIADMLDVRTALLREKDGELRVEGSCPSEPGLGPIDMAALDWTWRTGEVSGRGKIRLAASDWQFHALATSLGTLAVLAVARDDGTPPIPADRAVLLSTLIAQSALAHERLRLEDQAVLDAVRRSRN